jgi:hypothetical protein
MMEKTRELVEIFSCKKLTFNVGHVGFSIEE